MPAEDFDTAQYARTAASIVVDYLSDLTGVLGKAETIAARAAECWVEQVTVDVTRTLKVRWDWRTVAGNALIRGEHTHVSSEAAWEREASVFGDKLLASRVSASAMETLAHKAPFSRSFADSRVYEPTQRLGYRHACGDCGGRKALPCGGCQGTGKVVCTRCNGSPFSGLLVRTKKGVPHGCRKCRETGLQDCLRCDGKAVSPCKTCRGTGEVTRVTEFKVSVAESRQVLPQSVSNAHVGLIVQQRLAEGSLLDGFAREERLHEAATPGQYIQRFTLSVPVCRLEAVIGGVKDTLFVMGYQPQVLFAAGLLDPVARTVLERCESTRSTAPWNAFSRWKTAYKASTLVSSVPLFRRLRNSARDVRVRSGAASPSESMQILDGGAIIAERMGHALSAAVVDQCLAFEERRRKSAFIARLIPAVVAALLLSAVSWCLRGVSVHGLPVVAAPVLAAAGTLGYPFLLRR